VLVRHFGQAIFGQLNLAQSIAVQGMGIATCGLDTAGMRDVAANPRATSSVAGTVVFLRFLLGLVSWGTAAGLTWIVPQYRACFELTALYGISMFTGALTVGWVAQAHGRMLLVGLAHLTPHILYFAGVQSAVRSGWPAASVPLAMVMAEAISAAGLWVWYCRLFQTVIFPPAPRAALNYLRQSVPIGSANIVRGLTVGSDIVLLGLFASESDVGLYSASFKLYSLGLSLILLYGTVLLPQLAACGAGNDAEMRSVVRVSLRRTLLVALAVLLIGLVTAGAVLQLLFGPNFEASAQVLRVLLVALPANLIAGHCRSILVAGNRQRHDLRVAAIGMLVHVATKLGLIPLLGITGAAWGTVAGEAALMLLSWGAVHFRLESPAATP
jgi:O-antigen/teichoic acid export membrane protein